MDSLSVENIIREHLPFLNTLPLWLWLVIVWIVTNLLLKPYMQAVVRLYQPKFDLAAKKTPSIIKRFLIELLRIILISTQFPHSFLFLITPKEKRLRIWRKNHIIYYIWLYSRHFPRWSYYRRVRKWFEKNVYLNEKTSYTAPEPLKQDGAYIEDMLKLDKIVTHEEFIKKIEEDFKPIIRVGLALKMLNPKDWIGSKKFILWIVYSWLYNISFIIAIYFLLSKNILFLYFLITGIVLFRIDRLILRRRILYYAKFNKEFYTNAIEKRVIQLNW
jgi:hypothetical protein